MTAPKVTSKSKRPWIIGGLLVVAGYVAMRWFGRAVSPPDDEDTLDDNAPHKLVLRLNERSYPPFYDREVQGVRVEGEFDEEGSKQLVVFGIDQQELDTTMSTHATRFAVACGDSAGLWHPAVAERALLYGKATDQHGDVYALAAYVGPSILMLLPGAISADGHFTAYKSTRIVALTNSDGLLYDYPNVPVIDIVG
jgi:hypothetical protein